MSKKIKAEINTTLIIDPVEDNLELTLVLRFCTDIESVYELINAQKKDGTILIKDIKKVLTKRKELKKTSCKQFNK